MFILEPGYQSGSEASLARRYQIERLDEFFDGDCAICQAEKAEIGATMEAGEKHGWQWHYDPEGWDAHWAEDAQFEAFKARREEHPPPPPPPAAPDYEPLSTESPQVDAQTFLEFLRQPWLNPALRQVAQQLAQHCDVPLPDARLGLCYRRVT